MANQFQLLRTTLAVAGNGNIAVRMTVEYSGLAAGKRCTP